MLPERTELQEDVKIVALSLCLYKKVLTPISTGKGQALDRMRLFSLVLLSPLEEVPGGNCSQPPVSGEDRNVCLHAERRRWKSCL